MRFLTRANLASGAGPDFVHGLDVMLNAPRKYAKMTAMEALFVVERSP
jgi:hypothetical protein